MSGACASEVKLQICVWIFGNRWKNICCQGQHSHLFVSGIFSPVIMGVFSRYDEIKFHVARRLASPFFDGGTQIVPLPQQNRPFLTLTSFNENTLNMVTTR